MAGRKSMPAINSGLSMERISSYIHLQANLLIINRLKLNVQVTKLMRKYGVTHKVATPYHPQTSGQAETSNRQVNGVLDKTVRPSRKDWAMKLNNALWAYRTAYKTPLGMSPYRVVFEKACHLPVEVKHKAYWWINELNFDLKMAGNERMLQILDFDELRNEAYDNSRIYKDKVKRLHDKRLVNKQFELGMKVLMFSSRLRLFPRKLKSRWSGPFEIISVFPYGVVELMNPRTKESFKVNGHRAKSYLESLQHSRDSESILLEDPPSN